MSDKLSQLDEHKILVLDIAYQPVGIIDWERAMYLQLSNKAEVLNTYEHLSINSPTQSFACPAVIRVKWLNKKQPHVQFSRWSVLARDNFSCAYCGNHFPAKNLTLDHVIPDSQGGEKNWHNIITACMGCNHRKANRTPEQAGMELYWQPYAPKWNPWFIVKVSRCEVREIWKQWLPELT